MATADLPGFEILDKVGTGGMATVWRARQISLDRIVAIKILNPSFTSQPDDVLRFQREAQSAAKLKHSGVVQVYDASALDGLYYFVMEYVSGYTVGEWIRRKGKLSESNALLVVECVAAALQYAWESEQIIHCDIKPDNILVDADGTVKVSDLGLARTLSAMARLDDESDEVMGTPYYISPEQALGRSDLDCRADIYSLGAMLYHMLTGKMPFQDADPEDVMELQVNAPLPPVQDVVPDISNATAALVDKMTAKEPDERIQNWDAVIAAVKAITEKPAKSHPVIHTRTMRMAKRSSQIARINRRSRKPFIGTLLILFIITAVLVYTAYHFRNKSSALPVHVPPAASLVAPATDTSADDSSPPSDSREDDMWHTALKDARDWSMSHPMDFNDAIARFQAIVDGASGSKAAESAAAEIDVLKINRDTAIDTVLKRLRPRAVAFAAAGEYARAASVMEQYDGQYAAVSRSARMRDAQAFRDRISEAPVVVPPQLDMPSYDKVVEQVAAHLVRDRGPQAVRYLEATIHELDEGEMRDQLQRVHDILTRGVDIDAQLADSLRRDAGRPVTLGLTSGSREVVIQSVEGDQILVMNAGDGTRPDAPVSTISIADLSHREKLRRLDGADSESLALSRGILALRAHSRNYAIRYFSDTHPDLALALLSALQSQVP